MSKKMFRNNSIRKTILITLGLLLIIILSISGVILVSSAKADIKSEVDLKLKNIVQSENSGLNNWLNNTQKIIEDEANCSIVKQVLLNPNDTIIKILNKELLNKKNIFKGFAIIGVTNLDGETVSASMPNKVGNLNIKDRDYFKNLISTEKKQVSKLVISKSTGKPVLVFASPIKKDGKLIGSVFASYFISAYSASNIDLVKIGKTGYGYIVNEDGDVIAYPNKKYILKLNLNKFNWWKEVQKNKSGILKYTYAGIAKRVAYVHNDKLNWVIAATAPDSEIFVISNNIKEHLIVVITITALFLIIAIVIVSYKIQKKFANYTKQANTIIKNLKLGKAVELLSLDRVYDESKSLIESINHLVERAKWYENILDSLPIGVSVTDNDLNWTFINKKVENLIRKPRKKVIGTECKNWGTNLCNTDDCVIKQMKNYNNLVGEVKWAGKDYKTDSVYIKSTAGNVVGHIEILSDITSEKKKLEFDKKNSDYMRSESKVLNSALEKVAKGDLTISYTPSVGDGDIKETKIIFDELANSLNHTTSNLASIIGDINGKAKTVDRSSSNLNGVSQELSDVGDKMVEQTQNVAAAVEEVSVNMNTIASAVEEMSVNSSTVSNTSVQMSSSMDKISESMNEVSTSISKIANNSQQAEKISNEAVIISSDTGKIMDKLGGAAQEIGKITDVIKRISEQTNLLALNATIEAASAGEAGKGFAVVANEIKELASQSAKAAENIANMIDGIQNNSNEAISSIDSISNIVDKMRNSIITINEAVDKQNTITGEISLEIKTVSMQSNDITTNISEIAQGSNEVAGNAGEAARGMTEVSESIGVVNSEVEKNKTGVNNIANASTELSSLATDLNEIVGKFTV